MAGWEKSVLVAGVLGLACPVLTFGGATAVFPEISFDAGEVRQGAVVAHEFVVANAGDAPLHLTEVTPSCSCTVASYDQTVAAGGAGRIVVRIETGELPPGPLSKTITVASDAPGAERTVLQIKLTVVSTLEFLPHNPVYLVCEQGAARAEQVLLRVHEAGIRVLGVSSSNTAVRVSLSPAQPQPRDAAAGSGPLTPRTGDFWITLVVGPDATPGRQTADVAVRTSNPSVSGSTLKVDFLVKPASSASAGARPSPPPRARSLGGTAEDSSGSLPPVR